jgi:hypothetical protein
MEGYFETSELSLFGRGMTNVREWKRREGKGAVSITKSQIYLLEDDSL